MRHSTERILTSHVGSLPRPADVVDMIVRKLHDEEVDAGRLKSRVRAAVSEVVRHQADIGIDVVSDGEMSKPGFSNYIIERYTGFGGSPVSGTPTDMLEFPNVRKRWSASHADTRAHRLLECVGPIGLRDEGALAEDVDNLKAALAGVDVAEAFIPAVTPGQISFNFPNRYYPSHEAYLEAAADAMRTEYRTIADAGYVLQLDAPDMALSAHVTWGKADDRPPFQRRLELAVEAINHAIDGIPPAQVRLHICWGNYVGPHHHDVPLKDIVATILKAKVGGLSFEAANPRHEHEWEVFREVRLPPDMILLPGVIDTKTHHIEHPRLIAQRLGRYAGLVGRENVIASTDCGFSTWVGQCLIDEDVAWAKLAAMVEGAREATKELWR